MSQKVSFYILEQATPKARDLYACRLIDKAYSKGHSIYIHLQTPEEIENFDKQLWTFRDVSFVPHEIYGPKTKQDVQILIGSGAAPVKKDILVNLTPDTPAFYKEFNHIIELIPDDKELKASARKKYKLYQKEGLKVETFDIKTS